MSRISSFSPYWWAVFATAFVSFTVSQTIAEEMPRLEWAADVRTGQVTDQALRDVLREFQSAAQEPAKTRQKKMEDCFRKLSAQFKKAPEVDLIYVCQLIRAGLGSAAKKHLDQQLNIQLATYWPAHRLAIYLHAAPGKEVATAKELAEFSATLAAKEQRDEILAVNAGWLGFAVQTLRLSAPDNAEVEKTLQICVRSLPTQAAALDAGKAMALKKAAETQPARDAAAAQFDEQIERAKQELQDAQQVIKEKEARLRKARDTLLLVKPDFDRDVAPSLKALARLEPGLRAAQFDVDRAKSRLEKEKKDKEKEDRKEGANTSSKDVTNAEIKLDIAKEKLREIEKEQRKAETERDGIRAKYNQKYATELTAVDLLPKELLRDNAGLSKSVREIEGLESRKRNAAEIRAIDLLRPDIERILNDLD